MMARNNTKVSILIPIYGVEKYIERCARSLFEQTYENIEYVFVNDCTKDRSLDILKNVIEQYVLRKPHITIVDNERNLGLAGTRNVAMARATGDFVIHVDSDDYIERDTVEKCVAKQLENDADIVSFGCYREYKSKTVVQLPPLYSSPKDMCLSLVAKQKNGKIVNVGIWGRLIRRSLYAENHIKALPGANMAEDYQVVTRLAYFAKRIGVLNEPLAHYNLQNTGSYVNNVTMQTMLQTDRNFKAVFDFFVDKGDDYVEAVYRAQSGLLYRNAVSGIDNGFGRSYYEQILSKWKDVPWKIRKEMPFLRRCVFCDYRLAKSCIALKRLLFKRP